MKPIPRLNLDQSNCSIVHRVFGAPSTGGQKAPREFYVIKSTLENQKRIMTVRSQYILINQTEVSYVLRLFWVDKALKKIKVVDEVTLNPGGMTSLPDHPDPDLQQKLKICVKPSFSAKWSDEFKLQPLKEKLAVNENIIWGHHHTYSILRKEKTEKQGVFNFLIKPPMIVMNCLPCKISIKVSQA